MSAALNQIGIPPPLEASAPRVNGLGSAWCRLSPEAYWTAVDDELNRMGQPNALWLEELCALYAAGLTVRVAVDRVLDGRRVRP